jgi:hypothetical protein
MILLLLELKKPAEQPLLKSKKNLLNNNTSFRDFFNF